MSKYDDKGWDELPKPVLAAAKVLGYNETLWDNDEETSITDKEWDDLTKDEKQAAKILGYNKVKWYDECTWNELSNELQDAARILGYCEDSWNSDQDTDTIQKEWDDLTKEEQDAAEKLGYCKVRWYDDCEWKELPTKVQDAAKVLGFTEESWNNDHETDTTEKRWSVLTNEEKSAAQELGYYSFEKWCSDSFKQFDTYEHLEWEQLPDNVQKAAVVLGYNEDIWNNDGVNDINKKSWDELTSEEQDAATTLGYSQNIWDVQQ